MPILAVNVQLDGIWYGPGYGNADQVPADVAAQVDNPGLWVDPPATKPAAVTPRRTGKG